MKDGKNHDDEEITLRDLSRAALERLVMKYRAKRLSDRNPADVAEDEEKAESERKKLSDLHSEKKGEAPTPQVEEDDLPEGLADLDSEEASESEESEDKKAIKKSIKKA